MNYKPMLEQHKATGAVCTVATITVPIEEASRFGICNTNKDGSIYEFEEKPKIPKNNQASMGIYIFNTQTLIEYLDADEEDENSSNDFGKNVIPNLLHNGEKIYAYEYKGYWKDVGTISSLWEANIDLLGEDPILNLNDRNLRIYSKNMARPPQYIGPDSVITNSLISEGCRIDGKVENSVISGGVVIEKDAVVKDSVIMEDVIIKNSARVYTSIIDANATVESGVTIGYEGASKNDITVIASGSIVCNTQ